LKGGKKDVSTLIGPPIDRGISTKDIIFVGIYGEKKKFPVTKGKLANCTSREKEKMGGRGGASPRKPMALVTLKKHNKVLAVQVIVSARVSGSKLVQCPGREMH